MLYEVITILLVSYLASSIWFLPIYGWLLLVSAFAPRVITSYSIHYTKLYDMPGRTIGSSGTTASSTVTGNRPVSRSPMADTSVTWPCRSCAFSCGTRMSSCCPAARALSYNFV